MSKYDVGFELRLDQLLEQTKPRKRRASVSAKVKAAREAGRAIRRREAEARARRLAESDTACSSAWPTDVPSPYSLYDRGYLSRGGKARRVSHGHSASDYLVQTMRGSWTTVARHADEFNALATARSYHERGIVVRVKRGREVVWKPTIEGRFYCGGKARRGLPDVRFVSLKLSEPPQLKLSVDGHDYAYAGDGAVMVYAKGLLTRKSKRARVDGLNHARANLTLVAGVRPGGKRRFDPAQLAKGTAEELEHAATIKKIVKRKLPARKAAELIAKDHLTASPHHYDRLDAVEVPKRRKGLKAPRLKLLRRYKKLRVYIVDSNATRKIYGDFTGGGHTLVYVDFIAPNEIWLAEELFGIERDLYLLHEANEMGLMRGGMGYDEAHDASTALEQSFRKGKRKGLKAAITAALKRAAG